MAKEWDDENKVGSKETTKDAETTWGKENELRFRLGAVYKRTVTPRNLSYIQHAVPCGEKLHV